MGGLPEPLGFVGDLHASGCRCFTRGLLLLGDDSTAGFSCLDESSGLRLERGDVTHEDGFRQSLADLFDDRERLLRAGVPVLQALAHQVEFDHQILVAAPVIRQPGLGISRCPLTDGSL